MRKRQKILSIASGKSFPIPTPHKTQLPQEAPFMDILLHFNAIIRKKPNQRGETIFQGLKIMREEIQSYIPSLYMTTDYQQDIVSMEVKNLFHLQLFKLHYSLVNLIENEFLKNGLEDKIAASIIKECLQIMKFFIRIPDTFMVKLPSFSSLASILLKIILAVLKSRERLYAQKSILKKALSVFNTLLALVEVKFKDEDFIIVKQIVDNMAIVDFNWGVKFISSFFNDFSERIVFKNLNEFNTKIKMDSITKIEAILANSPNLLDRFFEVLVLNIEIFDKFLKCDTKEKFITCLISNHMDGLFIKAGMSIPKIESSYKNRSWLKFKRIYKNMSLNKYFNMLGEYCFNISMINEAFMILNSFLLNTRRIFLKKFLHKKDFIRRFMNPLARMIFCREVEESIRMIDEETNHYYHNSVIIARHQFLRICLYYCDGDITFSPFKLDLISNSDFRRIEKLVYEFTGTRYELSCPQDCDMVAKELMSYDLRSANPDFFKKNHFAEVEENSHDMGLLFRILNKFYEFDINKKYIFWVSSFFESYTRGNKGLEAIIFSFTGVFDFIIDILLSNRVKKVNTKQIFFDFLGELIKFNKFNLNVLLLLLKERQLEDKFFDLINSNHIDSNVLTRSIVITTKKISLESQFEIFLHDKKSLEFCYKDHGANFENIKISQGIDFYTEETAKNSLIKKIIFNLDSLLYKLLESVTNQSLSSENICCLNTFFVMIMIIRNDASDEESYEYIKKSLDFLKNKDLLEKFEKILLCWDFYYTSRTREIFRLEYSTDLRIVEFFKIKTEVERAIVKMGLKGC